MIDNKKRIIGRLHKVYAEAVDTAFETRFMAMLDGNKHNAPAATWSEQDSFLITYGDTLLKEGDAPLQTLHQFANKYLKNIISTIHILPFFPYSSDDGFSVIDFEQVNPELGAWKDVRSISTDFKMMFDLVINHVSSQSEWFSQFLKEEAPGRDFVLVPALDFDASRVVRPRSSPLLSVYNTLAGEKKVWTTFSADQIDLNYQNPELLMEMIRTFLSYVEQGAGVIRLDAIAFLWKRSGKTCLHEDETHEIVKLFRDVVDYCCPNVVLLTETNVPHKENISYFGNGDEAQMVYQFPLPPLLLYTLNKGNAHYLKQWLQNYSPPGKGCTFFNFTASHDGIGLRPLEGLMPDEEKIALADDMRSFGGLVNTRRTVEGLDVPYELNITYFDALKGTHKGLDDYQAERFICSQTLMMSLQGVPAFYIHSLFATPNDYEGVAKTQQNRSINRRKLNSDELERILTEDSPQKVVFETLIERIKCRRTCSAFHPEASQELVPSSNEVVIIKRHNALDGTSVTAVFNVSDDKQIYKLESSERLDLISGNLVSDKSIILLPYQCLWLTNKTT